MVDRNLSIRPTIIVIDHLTITTYSSALRKSKQMCH